MRAKITYAATVVIDLDDDRKTTIRAAHTRNDETFRPGRMVVKYHEIDGGWKRGSIEVSGPLVRTNGSLSVSVSRKRYYGGFGDPPATMPPHLLALVEENQPKPLAS